MNYKPYNIIKILIWAFVLFENYKKFALTDFSENWKFVHKFISSVYSVKTPKFRLKVRVEKIFDDIDNFWFLDLCTLIKQLLPP